MVFVTGFAEQNWLITPAATAPIAPQQVATTQPPPPSPPPVNTTGSIFEAERAAQAALRAQQWLLTLSGIALIKFEGTLANDWNRETFELGLEPAVAPPLEHIIGAHRIARPSQAHVAAFQVEQAAPFVGLSSIFGNASPRQPGYAVDNWRVGLFDRTEAGSNAPLKRIFATLVAALAVRNRSAGIFRIGYTVSMLGRIRFVAPATIF